MTGNIRKLVASLFAVALLGSAAFAQLSVEDAQANGINIATANEIPYGWIDETGEARGIAPETAIAVLETMGITDIQWTQTEFGQLIPGLIANRWDIAAASQAILPARCEQVTFSKPNSSYGEGFLVPADNPKGITGYQDFVDDPSLRLGIVSGADQLDFAHAYGISDGQIVAISNNTDALSAVATGRVDAYAATGLTVARLAENSDQVQVAEPFEDPVIDGVPVRSWGGFTFNQASQEFVDAFNEALAEFQQTDQYREILKSHGLVDQDIDLALEMTTEELCSAGG